MPLHYILPHQLPTVWDKAAPLLQKSIDVEPDFITIEQVEYAIRTGKMHLLVWEEPDVGITGAAAVEFIDYPRYRVGHGTLLGGKGVVKPHVLQELLAWMKANGATVAQCWCRDELVPMYKKMGMEETHHVMRIKL
jgi:hypothetical protein